MMPANSGLIRLIEQEHERLVIKQRKALCNICLISPKMLEDLEEKQHEIDSIEQRTVEISALDLKKEYDTVWN